MIYKKFHPRTTAIWLVLASGIALVILVRSLIPSQPSLELNHMDKILHVLAYWTLGVLAYPALPRVKPFVVWVGLCAFGGLVEAGQGLIHTGRTADILDGVSNGVGAILALCVWIFITAVLRRFNYRAEN